MTKTKVTEDEIIKNEGRWKGGEVLKRSTIREEVDPLGPQGSNEDQLIGV